MTTNMNDIINYGNAKFKVVKNVTSENIKSMSVSGSNGGGVPLAAIIPWVDDVNTVPAGFSLCDGSAVSRTTYADLFGAIGTKYGSGDGSTTFNLPDLTDAAILNGSYDKTSFTTAGSTTFTAPKTGYYKITVKGAGGGGQGSNFVSSNYYEGGGAGGEGGTTIAIEYMSAGDAASVVVGAGGIGGAAGGSAGANGGNSTVTVNLNTYTGGGGEGGSTAGAAGGSGTIKGASGGGYTVVTGISAVGSVGAGAGGSKPSVSAQPAPAVNGGGGAGGSRTSASYAGGTGGDGYVWIEYIGTASQYLIKNVPTVVDSEQSAAASASQAQAAAQAAESYAGSAGIPVGTLFPFAGDVSTPPTGFLACDGSAVSRAMYADLFSAIGTTYGPGDGSTTFNLPDEEFLKGMAFGANSAAPIYGVQSKAMNLSLNNPMSAGNPYLYYGSGGLSYTTVATSTGINIVNKESNVASNIYADMSGATPEYSSNIHYIIKAYDGVTPTSAGIDMTQYAGALNGKASRGLDDLTAAGKDRFLGDDNFCIIYPNNGTAANPANITYDSSYVMSNPFPGYAVDCVVEVLYNGEWGNPNFVYYATSGSMGAKASQISSGDIVIQTGNNNSFLYRSNVTGNPFQNNSLNASSAPARVKVWKIGKVANS